MIGDMALNDYGFADEEAFFQGALQEGRLFENFRAYTTEQVQGWLTDILADAPAPIRAGALLRAMQPFETAFRAYAKRRRDGKAAYAFLPYYRWWARQYAAGYVVRFGSASDLTGI